MGVKFDGKQPHSKCQVWLQDMSGEFANQLSRIERHIKGLARDIVIRRQKEGDDKAYTRAYIIQIISKYDPHFIFKTSMTEAW